MLTIHTESETRDATRPGAVKFPFDAPCYGRDDLARLRDIVEETAELNQQIQSGQSLPQWLGLSAV